MKTIDTIIGIGAMFYRVERSVLRGRLRDTRTVRIRNSVISACRNDGHKLLAIGSELNRDHATIAWSLERMTPQFMGDMWRRHEMFLDVVKSSDDADLHHSTNLMIDEIDAKIRSLQKIREMMVGVRKRITTETPAHWQEKG